MDSLTKINIAWNLWRENIGVNIIAERCNVHKATVYRWIKQFKTLGLRRTLNKYKNAKKKPRPNARIDPIVKKYIYKIREEYHDCCGEKIKYYLKKQYDITVARSTIYRILNEKYKLRKRYKNRKYGEVPEGTRPREVVQADTVDFGEVYAYTYIDTYTREVCVDLELDLESESGYASLTVAGNKFGKIEILQTDGGPEFQGEFLKNIERYAEEHRVSRAYKKNEQAFIESFNRTLRKECLGWRKYELKELRKMKEIVGRFVEFYNQERPHLGLDMKTPNDIAILSHLI
jgi:transposase InsO family protein